MAFWITLGRSLFAVTLGVAILFWPDKARPLLANFIGGFWLAGSLLTIRWGFAQKRSRLITLLVGLIGAFAGLAMVSRSVVDRWVAEEALFTLIGIVAVFTGILHITGHMQIKKFTDRDRTRSGIILGIFEILIGLTVILTPWQERALINVVLIAWSLVGGIVIFFDALAMRREEKRKENQPPEPDS